MKLYNSQSKIISL